MVYHFLNAVYIIATYLNAVQVIAKMREKNNKNFNAKLLANPHKGKLRISTIISGLNKEDYERIRYEKYLTDINKEIERRNSIHSNNVKVSIASIIEKNKIENKILMLKEREGTEKTNEYENPIHPIETSFSTLTSSNLLFSSPKLNTLVKETSTYISCYCWNKNGTV